MSLDGPVHLLLLGGTDEARRLAARLAGVPGLRVVTSLAGRVRDHGPLDGDVRVGGFGGAAGLAAWVRDHAPVLVVDATHPFAQQISRNAVAALAESPTPLLRLQRPGWVAGPGDRWHRVPDLPSAAALVATLGQRALVTTGRQGLAAFTRHPALAGRPLVVRCVEPPDETLPSSVHLLRDRGPYTVPEERALLRRHRIDVLVTKDSGGDATRAKLDASRELGLPVVMVNRPPAPALGVGPTAGTAVSEVAQAEAWVRARVRELQNGGTSSEQRLPAGDVTPGVVRVGDLVRRPRGRQTATVHGYLAHLCAAGFEGAPHPVRLDGEHEWLTFLPGDVAHRPYPSWLADDLVMSSLGTLLRRLHDAAATFRPPPDAVWDDADASGPDEPLELVGHCDVTPENVVVRDGRAVGLIDFDLARPTTRLFDLATALRHTAPLEPPESRDPALRDVDAGERARLLCDAYGLPVPQRRSLLDVADRRFTTSYVAMRERARKRGGGWARMWADGAGERILLAQRWLRRNRAGLESALTTDTSVC